MNPLPLCAALACAFLLLWPADGAYTKKQVACHLSLSDNSSEDTRARSLINYRKNFDIKEFDPSQGLSQLQQHKNGSEVIVAGQTIWQTILPLRREAGKLFTKVAGVRPFLVLKEDFTKVARTLLPGSQPRLEKKRFELTVVAASLLWFVFYNLKIYTPDRGEDLDRWKRIDKELMKNNAGMMQPDLALVFYHPNHNLKAREKCAISKRTLERVLVCWQKDETAFSSHEFVRTRSLCGESSPSLAETQVALLQDVYTSLNSMGFDVDVFTSLDGEELIVSVSLHDEETIRQLLRLNRTRLQLQHWVVSNRLGIDQPDEAASSPPYVEYTSSLAQNTLGDGKTDFELFKVFGQHATKTGRGTILAGEQRIKHVYRYLNARLNLDFAVSQGLLAQWFPAHNSMRISELRASWGRWGLLWDISFVQPMTVLNNYLGSRVAFIFAWNGHYCKLLLALVPVALLFLSINMLAVSGGPNPYWNRGSVMGFSMIIAVWGRWAQNSWARQQQYFATLWDLNEADKDRSQRADFSGFVAPSQVDRNIKELHDDSTSKTIRMFMSWLITMLFCCFNFLFLVTWLNLWKEEAKISTVAMIFHAVIVQVFTLVFDWMAEELTEAENHKFQGDYYDSYLAKNFMFQFVNQYSGFFFIAIMQQYSKRGCAGHDCMGMIRAHLQTMLVTLAIVQAIMVALAVFEVERRLWLERRKLSRSAGEVPDFCFVEKQSKFSQFRIREQIQVMLKLVLTVGYVLIFGAVAPRIVPLALIVFAVQLRGGAVLLTVAAKRPVPRVTKGIGAWQGIINFLSIVGILFSSYLFVQFGPVFAGTEVLTKVTGMSLYTCFLFILRALVDCAVPEHSEEADTIIVRRDYVTRRLMEASQHEVAVPIAQEERVQRTAPYGNAVAKRDWSSIPKAHQQRSEDAIG